MVNIQSGLLTTRILTSLFFMGTVVLESAVDQLPSELAALFLGRLG